MRYPVVVHNIEYAGFGAIAPDLPHCHCHAETLDATLQKMAETIFQRLDDMHAAGESPPPCSEIDTLRNNPAYEGGIWAMIDVDHEQPLPKSNR